MEFEELLSKHKKVVERFVYFRISNKEDAEDLLQETYFTAFQKINTLKEQKQFKPWILKIARNKCNDYYRANAKLPTKIEYDLEQIIFPASRYGVSEYYEFTEILNALNDKDKEILNLYYFIGYSQEEVSKLLDIPIGTVKSRLHTAKIHFREQYSYTPIKSKGDNTMSLPKVMPDYKIIASNKEPFSAKCEELMGWLIVPRLNEKIKWALYDFPKRNQTEYVEMEVVGEAEVHGVEGVEIIAKAYNPTIQNIIDNNSYAERRFVAQLTDTHCRFLAESHKQDGITKYYTFLDDDEFIKNWGYGVDNCGKEINLSPKGTIKRQDDIITCDSINGCLDVVGRYTVIIGNKEFDTICVMDIESYDEGIVTEQYIDKNGKTILWRRFNIDNWKFERYQELWSNKLPNNERIYVNDKTYIHWYDCISDYID